MSTFPLLGISKKLTKGLKEMNIITPTEIQEKSIPILLGGKTDLVAQAPTGTGKTAAFGLPVLQKILPEKKVVQALILCPTRELGIQIQKQLFKFTKYTDKIYTETVYGGAPIGKQIIALKRPTHIIVATPGRLIELLEKQVVDLSNIHTIVLDEADEMLKKGFKEDLETILGFAKDRINIWLFSATMPRGIRDLIKEYISKDAQRIRMQQDAVVNQNIKHYYHLVTPEDKLNKLIRFLKSQGENRGLIFCRTKKSVQTLAKQLYARNFEVDAMHGDLLQKERDKVMRAFKGERIQILIATDLSARGIDVEGLAYVAHYELPDHAEYYTHRSGRTARAGREGVSVSFIINKEMNKLVGIAKELKIKISGKK